MSWKSARLVLIITYSVIAVMFVALFTFFTIKAYILDSKAIDTTKAVLSEKGIELAETVELNQKHSTYSFSLKNVSYDKDSLAGRMLGESYTKISDNQFKYEHNLLRITGSRILYENTAEREFIKGSVDVQQQTIDFLTDLGFEQNVCAVYNVSLNNGLITFEAVPKYKKYWVHGSGVKGSADANGIFYLEGTWFEPSKEHAEKISFCNVTSALVNLVYLDDSNEKTIDNIYANFYIKEEDSLKECVIPVPVYVIKCTDGSEYKFNAKNAMLYTNS